MLILTKKKIIFVLLFITAVIIGFFVWKSFLVLISSNQTTSHSHFLPSTSQSSLPTPTSSEIKKEIYKNSTFGFQMEIPPFFVKHGYKITENQKSESYFDDKVCATIEFQTRPVKPYWGKNLDPEKFYNMIVIYICPIEYCKEGKGLDFCEKLRAREKYLSNGDYIWAKYLTENNKFIAYYYPVPGDFSEAAGWDQESVVSARNKLLKTFHFLEESGSSQNKLLPSQEKIIEKKELFHITQKEGEITYSFQDITISLRGEGLPGFPATAEVFFKNQKINSHNGSAILEPRYFLYNERHYLLIPVYIGGAYGPYILYFYLHSPERLEFIGEIITYEYSSEEKFYIQKNGEIFLTGTNAYSFDRRNVNNVYYYNYYKLTENKIENAKQLFQKEYLKKARETEGDLNLTSNPHKWSLYLIEAIINYMLAGEKTYAKELFNKNAEKFYSINPEDPRNLFEDLSQYF